jgi:hypothetical protein
MGKSIYYNDYTGTGLALYAGTATALEKDLIKEMHIGTNSECIYVGEKYFNFCKSCYGNMEHKFQQSKCMG